MRPLSILRGRQGALVQGAAPVADVTPETGVSPVQAEPEHAPEPALTIAQRAARARKAKLRAEQASEGASRTRPRRDPAPSRVAYKMHRLWLTPVFRKLLRVGVPLVLTFAVAYSYLADPVRQGAISAGIMEISRSVKTRPEFMVKLVAIEGATPEVGDLIRESFPISLPVSSFDLDLEVLQAEIAELDVIESAALRIRPGGVLEINVTQRQPEVIWRSRSGLILLDHLGNQIATISRRAERFDLPLLAGAGAQDKVREALALMRAARPISAKIRGLVRVGQRRWDVVLTGGITIRLPEENPIPALNQVIALNEAQDLLARAVLTIDMRNPLRPTLRMAPEAHAEMRRIKAIELGDPS